MTKLCKGCNIIKEIKARTRYCINCYKVIKSEYAKKDYQNRKEYIKYKSKEYQEKNKEKVIKKVKEWIINNKDKHKQYCEKWRLNNLEKVVQYQKERYNSKKIHIFSVVRKYQNKKYKNDINYKIRKNINAIVLSSFKRALGGKLVKNSKSLEILGCDIEFFIDYISSKFENGMTIENHGKWHLDHIYPISLAKSEDEIIKLNHYTNFQPLWAIDNLKKQNKIIQPSVI
jgi:hypothetical protein